MLTNTHLNCIIINGLNPYSNLHITTAKKSRVIAINIYM